MRLWVFICAITMLTCSVTASPDAIAAACNDVGAASTCQRITSGVKEVTPSSEPVGVGGGLVLDEHIFTNGSRDRDYNGGGELTLSGERSGPIGRALDRALGFIDEHTCPRHRYAAPGWETGHAIALGLLI